MALKPRTLVLGALGALIFGGLAYVSFRPEPVLVDLHDVSRGDFTVTVNVDGVARVADVFEISAPISGVAQRIPVAVGEPVVAGQTVLARVEPASPALLDTRSRLQAEATLGEARAALLVAETQEVQAAEEHAFAQSNFDRTQSLVERGVVSITQLEQAEQTLSIAAAAVEAAAARVAQARSGVERAEAALVEVTSDDATAACCVDIISPIDGLVLDIDMVSARPVTMGAPLLTIGDPARLEVVADILSADAVRLPEAAMAHVERWGGDPLEARLFHIEPAAQTIVSALGIEEQRVDAVFEITSPPDLSAGLGHQFAVYLRVIEYEEQDALLVPLNAIFRNGQDWAVFVAEGDTVRQVPVEIGRQNASFATVLSGLEEGARVVEHPHDDLADGVLVAARQTF